jgi:hypothetical protein
MTRIPGPTSLRIMLITEEDNHEDTGHGVDHKGLERSIHHTNHNLPSAVAQARAQGGRER